MAGETSKWMKFFENAGLPSKISSKYSSLFQEHRIQWNMMSDLTKSILNEVGVTAVGDVLAILKQAKMAANTDDVEMKEPPAKMTSVSVQRTTTVAATSPGSSKPMASPKTAIRTTTTTATAVSVPTKIRRQSAPDFDVVYRVNMPKGTTERSRQLLEKAAAAALSAKSKQSTSPKSVFDRLGAVVKSSPSPTRGTTAIDEDDEEEDEDGWPLSSSMAARLLRKSVSFASGTKESSPEVTSTTDGEYDGRLESDKMARKVSALHRLGSKQSSSSSEVVKVVDGQRRLLVAKRISTEPTTVKTKTIFDRLG